MIDLRFWNCTWNIAIDPPALASCATRREGSAVMHDCLVEDSICSMVDCFNQNHIVRERIRIQYWNNRNLSSLFTNVHCWNNKIMYDSKTRSFEDDIYIASANNNNKAFSKWNPVSLSKRHKVCWSNSYFWIYEFRNKNHFYKTLFEVILISEFTYSKIRITSTFRSFWQTYRQTG